MARMHSRKHGKHGSTKPPLRKHSWLIYDKAEVEGIIKKLAKEGKQDAEIGMVLRDQYGVPNVRALGLRVSRTTHAKKVPDDIYNMLEKAVNLRKHLDQNHGDANSKHGFELLESKIRRLQKYYLKTGKLPKGWKYTIEQAKLIVK